MSLHSVAYHGGFTIDIHISPAHSAPPAAVDPRYNVLWTVCPAHRPDQELGSFAEPPEFASTEEARLYAVNRAQTFIHALLSLPAPEPAIAHDVDETIGHHERAIARND
jgi:hypothetical protein